MRVHTICRSIVPEGTLPASLSDLCAAEVHFTREAGVLERLYYQCVQQPHVIWARTEWTGQSAHDAAARMLMEVREDDRVAAAWFRPGLYFEAFCLPVQQGCREFDGGAAGLVIVSHGLVDDARREGWEQRLAARLETLAVPAGLLRLRTYRNYRATGEFVAFSEWRNAESYERGRISGERSVEEHLLVEPRRSDLAAYDQYECAPLAVRAS